MKIAAHIRLFTGLLLLISVGGCYDPSTVFDQNTEIVNRNWSYANKIKYDVEIKDTSVLYNLYLNLRVTGDYKYANMFVLISQNIAGTKPVAIRYEFKLANPDGEWTGKGTGNIYSYQTLFKPQYKFPARGVYHFELEQNMRDNPLHEVSDVGIRVAKVQ